MLPTESLQEAIGLLTKLGDEAKVIAGANIASMLKMRLGDMSYLIDIGRLPDLSYIEQREIRFISARWRLMRTSPIQTPPKSFPC